MHAEVANCVPAITLFVAKWYDSRPAGVLFRMDSGKTRMTTFYRGIQQACTMGPTVLCRVLWPVLRRSREKFEREGLDPLALWNIHLGLMVSRPTRLSCCTPPARARQHRYRGQLNPAKTAVLLPKGHAPKAREVSILKNVDARIADRGRVTVVSLPIGTEENVVERAVGVLRVGGADR